MRDYGKVYTAFWISEDARSLSEDGRMLALYLLTCQHSNMLGCFRLTNAYAADDLQWDIERVSKGFQELLSKALRDFSEVFPVKKLDDFEAELEPFENPFDMSSKTRASAKPLAKALTTPKAGDDENVEQKHLDVLPQVPDDDDRGNPIATI